MSQPQAQIPENTVLIGQKPVINYVTAALTQFERGSKEIVLKARGKSISKAVDTAEILRRNFVKDLVIKQVRIGTEKFTTQDNRTRSVSSIEIVLARGQ
ncbi:DNA-binding protein Alba [Candidatus Marsarchaeota G1 archaeon OSP_B]|jgi:DNA-binding protein|uniref:DNA/RNA-binding protein Alba n=5 Tax=Candidatus Marsarchaeota TaxID=1978152 RepID=A0A2R6AJ66_9ARCH|nr:MAG: DNA-binding protein Alba [Candidatus Marsarchaeota G1 archaeon OSP_D]PSN86435.1 MAG: DNA-binding protein Alba [Candidatus Marsarchaeota G1 archaeon BE_D]PSN87335.1 MAG: DNA-binding protein Alba [Candidatus Marsarchaeota G1 archaeon OSP_B]PSN89310.1 MAG: DNA-binding protein Alba [Candidatus Marsarchaeota G1 archaeon OSP_C]PSO03082.1 MAG: DNA-binding protein Alba [Candidatus Marsarchaeota G2 archaeon ECH_B_SAG-E12]